MADATDQLKAIPGNVTTGSTGSSDASTTNAGQEQTTTTLQKVERTTSEKVITSSDWLSVSVTLWPVVAVIAVFVFRKQIASVLQDLGGFTFGSFSLKLRRRLSKVAGQSQFEKVKDLSAYDLKFFFVVASQSWKIKNVDWGFDIHENLKLHDKLETAGLVEIKNKATAATDKKVNAVLTPFGEELYQELTSLISESIR